jgi:hypothetical protein
MELLRWGRLWEVATNFILVKAKFAVACGQFDENFNAGKKKIWSLHANSTPPQQL